MYFARLALIFTISSAALYADNILHPGVPKLDRPTLTALGIQLPVIGDDNFNSTVSVQFKVSGTPTWQSGLPLFRVHPETVAAYTVVPQFAGSIFDLKPGTTYDIQLHAVDPDGADQTFTLTATTRSVPVDPPSPHVRNVTDTGTLVAALSSAQPGDVITLANGLYTGQFGIFTGGTAANPIVIRGASEDGVILDGNNCVGCNVLEVYGAGYVHVERMTVQNATRAIRFQSGNATGNVVRRVHVKNTDLGIGAQPNQFDSYIADNILEGRLVWPHVYFDDAGTFANNDGIAVMGFGHVVTHNRISGYGDAMKTNQNGARANDFYGNEILFTYDNGIELDESEGNTRCFRNRFMNTFSPISVQPIHGGPSYILHNVVINIVAEQLKFHALGGTPPQGPSGVLVYNNTFVSPPGIELTLQTADGSHYFEIENNLFLAPPSSGPEAADWIGPIDHGTFDYNGYFPNGIFRFNDPRFGGYFFQPNFAGLQGLGMEPHGLIASGPIFASGLTAPSTYKNLMPPADATLAAGSLVLDRARLLPNINDNYQGSGPDLGALELGCPTPTYGPRADGVDESNEVIGCGSVSVNTTSVTVAPATVTLTASQTQQFSATTVPAGGSATWSISPARGSITAAGLYTAPADAKLGEQVIVTAVSTVNGAVSGTATVKLSATVTTTLTPATVTVAGSQTQQFTATVTGAMNTAVSYIQSPATGTITAAGLFTAPAATSSAQSITLTAVSAADATKTATATIAIPAFSTSSLAVTPGTMTLGRSQTQQFTATTVPAGGAVTWSVSPARGTVTGSGLYSAPADALLGEQVTVKAVSTQNNAISGAAVVKFTATVVTTLSPGNVTLAGSATQQFAANVSGAVNGAVTWSMNPALGSITTGGMFTAPVGTSSAQSTTVTATSVADPSKTASATVTVSPVQPPTPVTVSVSPNNVLVRSGSSRQFSASVTGTQNMGVSWSISPAIGTITQSGLYTAPSSTGRVKVTVTATSLADPTASGAATATILW